MIESAALLANAAVQAGAAQSGGGFEPLLPGLIVLLPLIGFALNGILALVSARRGADAIRLPAAEGSVDAPAEPPPGTAQ